MAARRRASGRVRATSSMSIPPSAETMATYRWTLRSRVMAA